jgi:hypothetical protein
MSSKFLNKELVEKFENYRKCIFYNPFNFREVCNNGFELQTFSRTYLTKFMYKNSQKGLSNEQIKNNLLKSFCYKDFINYKQLDNNLVLTNNKYPYVSTNDNPIFIIWDISGKSSILDIKKIVDKYFSSYNFLIWRNPFIHQSVKLIKHYHLVIRKPIKKPILTKVLLLVRHGPREPIHLPKNFDSSYWSEDTKLNVLTRTIKARMTNLGKLYCIFRGEEAKKYYEKELFYNSLEINDILVESSYVERTQESAKYYMKGLGFDKCNIEISNFLASDKILNHFDLLNYKLFMDNFNLNIDTSKLNNSLEKVVGEKINNSMDFFHILSTTNCYKVHNYNLPQGLEENYKLLEEISTLVYNEANDDKKNKYAKILGEQLLLHIFELLENEKKLIYLSTHDNMIMTLVKYISNKYELEIKLFDIPDFCSCIRFEIWNDDLLRIYYDSLFLIEIKIK